MLRIPFVLLLSCVLFCAFGQGRQKKKIILPDVLHEASGLCYVGPDSMWWLNDSGNTAELFLTDNRGRLKYRLPLPGAANRDWESLAADDKGNLYVGDFGNNGNRRMGLCIYIFNPASRRLDSIRFQYPDQHAFPPPPEQCNFDMEGFFWYADTLHLFSKNRLQQGNYFSKHYTLPANPGQYTAALRDSILLKKRVVTGAAISSDGKSVALLSYWFKPLLGIIPLTRTSIYLFQGFPETDFLKGAVKRYRVPHCIAPTQYESIDFITPDQVWVGSEKTVFFRQQARRRKL